MNRNGIIGGAPAGDGLTTGAWIVGWSTASPADRSTRTRAQPFALRRLGALDCTQAVASPDSRPLRRFPNPTSTAAQSCWPRLKGSPRDSRRSFRPTRQIATATTEFRFQRQTAPSRDRTESPGDQ